MFFKEYLPEVQGFVFDVDGVYSKGINIFPDGELVRIFNPKDKYATRILANTDIPVAIITGGTSEGVKKFFNDINVTDIYLGSRNKIEDFKDFYFKYDLNPDKIIYMGDDIPDLEVMQFVGIPVCPADAVPEIKAVSKYISDKQGGEGCVRDIIEQVLRSKNMWPFV